MKLKMNIKQCCDEYQINLAEKINEIVNGLIDENVRQENIKLHIVYDSSSKEFTCFIEYWKRVYA